MTNVLEQKLTSAKSSPGACNFHEYTDEYGPEKIVYVYEPRCKLKGIVVIDNTAIGPAIGGIRIVIKYLTRAGTNTALLMSVEQLPG